MHRSHTLSPRWIKTCFILLATALACAAQSTNLPPTGPVAAAAGLQAERESKFQAQLNQVRFVGRWTAVKEGALSPEQTEEYTILGAKKVGGEVWLIQTRMRYGQREINLPIQVKVFWADDTPVISITDFTIPGGGTYSARVLVYGGTYAGTWTGGAHGGLLNGVIRPANPNP